jgi:hypothetical protein
MGGAVVVLLAHVAMGLRVFVFPLISVSFHFGSIDVHLPCQKITTKTP